MTRRLLLTYLLITVGVLVLLEIPLGIFFAQRERERITADLEHDAYVMASLYEDALEERKPPDPRPAERYFDATGARTVVVDEAGVSIVDTDRPVQRDFSTRPEFAVALGGHQAEGTRASDTIGSDLMYVAVPVASGGQVHGAVRITVDTSDVTARIRRFWLALAAIGAIVLALVALVGWAIARWTTRPIRRLELAAGRFARGDLRPGGPSGQGPPEVRRLGSTMDDMAARLNSMMDAQRQFTADAAHQLRTPLTALRLRLDNLESELQAAGPRPAADQVEAIADEVDRMSALVHDLLRLARAEGAAASAPVDVRQIATERVDTWSAVAEAQQVELRLSVTPRPAFVAAPPGGVEQILDNVLDNALGFAPPGSAIAASVEATAADVVLSVVDHGPGLSDEQKARAVERFWRGGSSRPGTGLGLAIVDRLVVSSGGSWTLSDTAGGGLTVSVRLPASAPGAHHGGTDGRLDGRPKGNSGAATVDR